MFKATETLPASQDPFFLADFAEFQTIISQDKCFSFSDFLSIVKRNTNNNRKIDKAEMSWRDLSNFIGNRMIEFGDKYPFLVSDTADTIILNYNESDAQNFYIFLLIASSMRFILKNRQHEVARAFEESCFAVFKQLMPADSEVRATWAGGGSPAVYSGTLYQKMLCIAKDIRCTANFREEDFKPTDTGDGGIDLIAWHSMEDQREGIPLAFAQCGCSTTDWTFKQLEASPASQGHRFPVMHEWATYYFLPLDIRRTDGDWEYKSKLRRAIVIDRLRLTRLAERYGLYSRLPSFPQVGEALSYQI